MKKSFDVIDLLAEISYCALLRAAFGQEIRRIQFAVVLKTLASCLKISHKNIKILYGVLCLPSVYLKINIELYYILK